MVAFLHIEKASMSLKKMSFSVNKLSLLVILATAIILSGFHTSPNIDLKEVRELYIQSVANKKNNEALISKLKDANENTPVLFGYKGAAFIIMAKHEFYPWNKWKNFKKGRDILESIIQKYPDNYELRFIRYSIQSNLPGILNYSSAMEQDKKIVVEGFKNLTDIDLKNLVNRLLEQED